MAYLYLRKVYVSLTLSGSLYVANVSKVKTPLAVYLIRRTGIRFRDPTNVDTIQINPVALQEIKDLLVSLLATDTTNVINPSAIFLFEGTSLFLFNSIGMSVYAGGTVPTASTIYRGARGVLFFRICQATNAITSRSVVQGRFQYNSQTIYFILSDQIRTLVSIPENMTYGILQSGASNQYTEWICADILTCHLSDASKGLPTVFLSGVHNLKATIANNGALSSIEYYGKSFVNSLEFSDEGSNTQCHVLPDASATRFLSYTVGAVVYRDGCIQLRNQLILPGYSTTDIPGNYITAPVLLYSTAITTPRVFYASPMWQLSNQTRNDILLQGAQAGTFYFLTQSFIKKPYGLFTMMETTPWTAPTRYEALTVNFGYSKAPCVLSGGIFTAATHPAYKLKIRAGLIVHIGNPLVRFYTTSITKEGNAAAAIPITSTSNGVVGRILDLKDPDSASYFYDLYTVRLELSMFGITVPMTYTVRYDDNSSESYSVSATNQGGAYRSAYFAISSTGTSIAAIANPALLETTSAAITNVPARIDGMFGKAVGDTLVPNAAGKKIRYIIMETSGEVGTNAADSDIHDFYLGLILSPKTP